MNLTNVPVTVQWAPMEYVFLERVGSFATHAPQAWEALHKLLPSVLAHNQVTGYVSLYKVGPQLYRAGVSLAAPPRNLPDGLRHERIAGGKYAKFTLTGPYTDLGPASQRAWELASELKLNLRDDFNLENYVNDPRTTPATDLITEILFPIA